MADEEFEEEEVFWSYEVSPMEKRRARDSTLFSSGSSSKSAPINIKPSRQIPRSSAHVEEHGRTKHRQSAPIDIPDWSKIYGHNGDEDHNDGVADNGDDDDEDEDEDGRVPPHEWLAKKLARSQISSFSVCEGEGRTLKGRDQRKVRNAVLTRTGFLE